MAGQSDEEMLRSVSTVLAGPLSRTEKLAQVVAVLKDARPHYTWFGIYLLEDDMLVLGPYIGRPTEHVRIPIGSGICGLAARTKQVVNVADVNSDARYLACSLETRSELVIPIMDGSVCLGEIDLDSDTPAAFTAADEVLLGAAARLLAAELRKRS